MAVDKPNLSIHLASSYNERAVDGVSAVVSNALDQRKVNSIYQPVRNSITGNSTVYLVKRPGFDVNASSWGTTGQVAYLVIIGYSQAIGGEQIVFSKSGNDISAHTSAASTVIATSATLHPIYVDKTLISGTENIVVQIGDVGGDSQRAFYSSAIGTWTEITDSDWPGVVTSVKGKMEFMDGYAFALGDDNNLYNSDLNSLANWTASSYIKKQIQQDKSVGLARFGKQILAFGQRTCEVFINAGNASGSPLVSVPSNFHNVGLPGRSSGASNKMYYGNIQGKMYFIGRGPGGIQSLGVYAYNGSTFEKVSQPSIDKLLYQGFYSAGVIGLMGHTAFYFSIDAAATNPQRWFMFFPAWNEWFEWNSSVVSPHNSGHFFLGVGSNQHKLYNIATSDKWRDDTTDFTWTHQFQLPANGNERKFMPYCGLKGDTSRSAQNISVEFSDDDYQTFSSARTIDMTSKQKALFRCGSYQGARVVRLSHTGNTEVRLEKFLARIE